VSRLGALPVDRLREQVEREDFSGVVHLVGDEDEPRLTLVRGLADRASGVPNDEAIRFGVASVSKLLTGTTVARLVGRGVVRWDDRYGDLVGEDLRPSALDPTVTLRHLLSHTSGFGDYFDEEGDEPYEATWTRVPSTTIRGPSDMWPMLAELPQVAPPGTTAKYNNAAFILVGIALEAVTGKRFPQVVRDEVFDPLGMADSGFWPLDGVVPRLAVGYLPPEGGAATADAASSDAASWRTNVYAMPAMGGPDGGAQATAPDLIRLLDGVTGRGGSRDFLTPETRTLLIGPHVRDDHEPYRYGCGVLHYGEGSSARFGHTGEDPGFSARVWTYPASGERVVVLSNVTFGAGEVTGWIDDVMRG
jgi:CubicO group peptidase (beta-lactamase class C family)